MASSARSAARGGTSAISRGPRRVDEDAHVEAGGPEEPRSRVLGFSAVQLGHPAGSGVDLSTLAAGGLLTAAPPREVITLPGSPTEQAALGYLHANCSHCHNAQRPAHDGPRCFDPRNGIHLELRVDELAAPGDTAAKRTTGAVVRPGHPEDSVLIDRVAHRGFLKQMPPLATEEIDRDAVELLSRWIRELEVPR